MKPAPTLADSPLDLQITICTFLHPSDILALRKTCKALELATRQRIVWVAALHRVCLDNTLFLPSFPIPDMSDLELERAAMGPRRWIELCGALQKEDPTVSEKLHPQRTKVIESHGAGISQQFLLVPGGRFLVTAGIGLFVWDLGYVSTAECKLVDSVGLGDEFKFLMVQATPDGKGLAILSSYSSEHLSIFEIYPQSEKPLLTEIARLDSIFSKHPSPAHFLPDTLISNICYEDRIFFKVVDYRTNYSTCFIADVQVFGNDVETFATKTAIIIFCKQGVLIWAIPPLSPQPSNNPTRTPPLFKIPFPDDITRPTDEIFEWKTVSSWFFESWGDSVYFDMILYTQIQRFKITIKPDLSDASLHVIDAPESISEDLMQSLEAYRVREGYRICEGALVYFWNNHKTWGAYTGLTSAPFTKVVTRWDAHVKSLCPASGRVICRTDDGVGGRKKRRRMVVVDLLS